MSRCGDVLRDHDEIVAAFADLLDAEAGLREAMVHLDQHHATEAFRALLDTGRGADAALDAAGLLTERPDDGDERPVVVTEVGPANRRIVTRRSSGGAERVHLLIADAQTRLTGIRRTTSWRLAEPDEEVLRQTEDALTQLDREIGNKTVTREQADDRLDHIEAGLERIESFDVCGPSPRRINPFLCVAVLALTGLGAFLDHATSAILLTVVVGAAAIGHVVLRSGRNTEKTQQQLRVQQNALRSCVAELRTAVHRLFDPSDDNSANPAARL